MARLSITILLATVLLCLHPIKSQLSFFLRAQPEETPAERLETAIEATEHDDSGVSLDNVHRVGLPICTILLTFNPFCCDCRQDERCTES
jgi:hypothetical protein